MELHKGEKEKRTESELERTNTHVLELLRDKRRLNTELEYERKLSRKFKEECYDLRRRLREQQTAGCGSGSFSDANSLVSARENNTGSADLENKIRALEDSLRESRAQIKSLEEYKTVLESEILRLAEALGKDNSTDYDLDLYIQQLNIYETDFQKEKNDKEQAETKVSALTDQISDCQELISSLTREVDLYKNAFEREKKDKESALRRKTDEGTFFNLPAYSQAANFPRTGEHDQGVALPVHAPHLQVVYPIVDSRIQHQDSKRKRELHRRGVLTRDTPKSTDVSYDS